MRAAIIGDVHGCYKELCDLFSILNIDFKIEHYIFAGDLVHKGPESQEVVELVRNIGNGKLFRTNTPRVTLVKGNHEERHLRFLQHQAKGKNPMSHTEGYENVQLKPEDVEFLNAAIPYYKGPNFIVVHAGIPNYLDNLEKITPESKSTLNYLMRLRYVDANLKPLLELFPKEPHSFWAESYNGRFGHCYFGHQPFLEQQPKQFKHATGLDLGCVHGNKLAAAVILENEITYVTVPAYEQYADVLKE